MMSKKTSAAVLAAVVEPYASELDTEHVYFTLYESVPSSAL